MLLQTKPKTILWVSKKSPPLILGANFDIQQSGRQALTKWKAGGYVVTMVDTGGLNDGLTGFDVVSAGYNKGSILVASGYVGKVLQHKLQEW